MFSRSSAPRSSRSVANHPSSSSSPSLLTSLLSFQLSHHSQQPRRYLHKPSLLSLSVIYLVLLQSLFSTVSEAFQCTYPNYNTEVKPGQTSLLSWQATSADLSTYDSITATLYCMDIDGQYGGMWRTISTLFSNRGLMSTQDQYQFNVPNCGQLAKDVAIRIVARGKGGSSTQNGACYFMMDPKAFVVSTPPPSPPPPVTSNPPRPTANPVQSTSLPKPQLTSLPPGGASSSAVQPVATGTASSQSTAPNPTGSSNGGGGWPDGRPPNLPPLPPLPDDPSAQGSNGGGSAQPNHAVTIGATLGSICGFAIIAAVVSFLVIRRRRAHRRHTRGGAGSGGFKKHLRLQGRRLKGSLKDENDHFYMMRDDDDDEDYHHSSEKPNQVKSITAQGQKDIPDLVTVRAVGAVPLVPTVAKSPSLLDDISELHLGAWRQSSILSYPPLAHLPSSGEWKRSSSSSSIPTPSPTSEVFSVSSSAQVNGDEEVSSVVRNYWIAAMAARAERSAHPPPSSSSQSHKADILGFDDTPSSSRADRRHDSIEEGEESEDLDAAYKGWVRNPFRSTVNSIQSYVNRSISTGLQSRLRSFTTFNSSTPSSNFFDDNNSYMTEEDRLSHQQAFGFPNRVNSKFLEHLNIKALRHEQRQLEYYTQYYREHYPEVPFETEASITMTNESRRTSSVPSLTSTNDPFQTFDSNEIILIDAEVERDPFADPAQERIDNVSSTVAAATTYVPPPLPPSPLEIAHKGLTVKTEEQDRSNSVLLRSFPDPPSSPTSVGSQNSKKK